jgi:molybdate/tungstate transport system permease protein
LPAFAPRRPALDWKRGVIAATALLALHVGMALLPNAPFTVPMNLVLYFTNLYVLYAGATVLPGRSGASALAFVLGYVVLFAIVLVLLGKKPLFILLVVAFSSLFGSPVLVGFFAIFVCCFVFFQPYSFETFIPLSLVYALLWHVRKTTSWFARICLGGGLLALVLVLFPLAHLVTLDSAQTLYKTLTRPDVQEALGQSLGTSTLATAVVALWGVPLAYALARIEFRGKRWVESLVDVPILVPQSVAGVAFMVLLGPGSPVGQALMPLGIKVSGSSLGIVLAQIFVASPFLIKTAMTAFEGVPTSLERASRSLGASPSQTFFRIALPLASRGILVGAALSWARAISEFGCIILFASSPVTAPILVHTEFLRAGATESRPIATLLLVICVWIFVMLQFGQTLLPFALQRPRREGSA